MDPIQDGFFGGFWRCMDPWDKVRSGLLEELFERFSPMAFSIGMSILKSREDAEDLVQDLFAHKVPALLRDRPGLTPEEFGRILAAAARNLSIDRYRRRRRFPESTLDPEAHSCNPGDPGEPADPESALASHLKDLQPAYLEVLTLKYLFRLTWEEVATRLGLSQSGARKRAGLARKEILARRDDRGENAIRKEDA
ncbi:MAG TPA: sigma-70 family RNA polymerase sigma factor [Fibrobacteria bacterium]|nr:sigma-70 family RNA polymerase sigma factor [Fibrobacteria bacterium]